MAWFGTPAEGGGARLGDPTKGAEAIGIGRRVLTGETDAFAADVVPLIDPLKDLRGLADALNQGVSPDASPAFNVRLIVENDVQQGRVDLDRPIVTD